MKGGNQAPTTPTHTSTTTFQSSPPTTSTTTTQSPPLPPPAEDILSNIPDIPLISEDTLADLPDFSNTEFTQHAPSPLSTSLDSSAASETRASETPNEELEVFLDQIIDFLQGLTTRDWFFYKIRFLLILSQ